MLTIYRFLSSATFHDSFSIFIKNLKINFVLILKIRSSSLYLNLELNFIYIAWI